ncbi:MAG: M1 family metallopeptidase [Acidobacteriaceae bacterium]
MPVGHAMRSFARVKPIVCFGLCLLVLVSCQVQSIFTPDPGTSLPLGNIPTTQADPAISPAATSGHTPAVLPTLTPQVLPSVTADIQPTSTPLPSDQASTHYDLDAVFDYFLHTLSVTETVHYVNSSSDTLTDLLLLVEPNRWMGGFSLVSLAWQNGEGITQYDLQDERLSLSLPQGLAPGTAVGIQVVYDLLLPPIPPPSDYERPQPYGYTARQSNIVDWYPYIPPYRSGEGWLVHEPGWFGEHQVFTIASFDVKLTLAQPVKDLVIAASAPAEQHGETYTYHLEAARSFALSASDEYLVQSTSVGEVTVYSYSFPYDKYSAQQVLDDTANALDLFSQLIMPYPHLILSAVEADFLDGMEYDGLYFLSHGFYDLYDGSPKGYLTFIAAHETAHQWWYGLVGNDQALEPWLDEAMCTYMEHIFYENVYTDYQVSSSQSLLDWWWFYRVNFYDPGGWVDGTIYDFSLFRSYRNAIYLNGAKFLDALRVRIGDQAFFSFLRDYAHQEKYQLATTADFFTILREHTSEDLDDLLMEYFGSE